jgi:hypothetical protein
MLYILAPTGLAAANPALVLSVFATAPDVNSYLNTPVGREKTAAALRALHVSKIFLQGRLAGDFVPPAKLREIRDDLRARSFEVSGGIDMVPGAGYGVRQSGKLSWMNYQAEKTRRDVAGYFRDYAPVLDEIILDDAFCTADTSPESARARGDHTWAEYRQNLLVSLVKSMMLEPARQVRPDFRLIIKYPQWYDRFHLFGYEPARMSALADRVWVGTETRNPKTARLGYVQPTEGYINYRWLASVAGEKVYGAWFDHLDCTAQNFLDQAYQSVLAGAREITIWHMGPTLSDHPGNAALRRDWPRLVSLAERVRARAPQGIAFYKPVASASDENMYLADYLAMLGLPIVPVAQYPSQARVAFLAVQAAADPQLMEKVRQHLDGGATLVLTPALVRAVGAGLAAMAGVRVSAQAEPGHTQGTPPIDIDLGLHLTTAKLIPGTPLVTSVAAGKGRLMVLNVRTFSEKDFEAAGEVLLAPRPLGLAELPRAAADALRRELLAPLGVRLSAPAGLAFYLLGDARVLYNFLDRDVEIALDGQRLRVPANGLLWP